jgi:hypothetical protein
LRWLSTEVSKRVSAHSEPVGIFQAFPPVFCRSWHIFRDNPNGSRSRASVTSQRFPSFLVFDCFKYFFLASSSRSRSFSCTVPREQSFLISITIACLLCLLRIRGKTQFCPCALCIKTRSGLWLIDSASLLYLFQIPLGSRSKIRPFFLTIRVSLGIC